MEWLEFPEALAVLESAPPEREFLGPGDYGFVEIPRREHYSELR